jgi:hypothetical protein
VLSGAARADFEAIAPMLESECEHERLPGDPCPSPDRVWPHPYPCGCWPHHERQIQPVPDLIEAPKPRKIAA